MFRCPFCGDSKKNQYKTRGYIYARDNDYAFKCHNCGISTNFYGFLKFVDPNNLRNYVMEKFVDAHRGKTKTRSEIANVLVPERKDELRMSLHTIDQLPEEHYAKQYIKNRKIPSSVWTEIYYTDNFKQFIDDFFPGHSKEGLLTDARIILPHTDFDGSYTHIAGRALESGDKSLRYQIVTIQKDIGKVFGLHRLSKDFNEKVYITEGQFDSLMLSNSVASGDSNLLGLAHRLRDKGYKDITLIYDSEPRNRDLVRQIEQAVKDNQSVTLLPYNDQAKDLNEYATVMNKTVEEIKQLVDKNTFRGLVANLKFNMWRKS